MIRSLLLVAASLLLLVPPGASAQSGFPHLFRLDSRSADTLATPSPSRTDRRYRVTAWGTYSMWEDTLNSSVDPVWIYSFPEEEWAKPEWRIFPEGYPIYVGDRRMFDSHGLRVDDRPFPEQPLNDDHRYSMIIPGTGRAITTAIVDWNFAGLRKQDAHDNNSGILSVLIEELPTTDVELCSVDSSAFPSIRVGIRVMRDSVQIEDLREILAIRENGKSVTIDSIDCSERTRPVSVALVVDRSGSMSEEWGTGTRMTAVREAARGFIRRLLDTDEAALYSFGTDIRLDQSWTSSRQLLERALDRLTPRGYTAMNDAINRAVGDVAVRPAQFRKAVVLLSDGEDNISRIESIREVADAAIARGVPVFSIGLLLENADSLKLLASMTGGAYFAVDDPGAIDSVFGSIAELLFEKGCCNVWYRTPTEGRDGTYRAVDVDVVYPQDTTVSKTDGYRAPVGTSSVDGGGIASGPNIRIDRTDVLIIEHPVRPAEVIDVEVFTTIGARVADGAGQSEVRLDLSDLPAGPYFVVLRVGEVRRTYPIVVGGGRR